MQVLATKSRRNDQLNLTILAFALDSDQWRLPVTSTLARVKAYCKELIMSEDFLLFADLA